jgi:DNA-binding transcriptional MerR regulator
VNLVYSLDDLVRSVQSWCDERQVTPASGQAAEALSERTIRYYRTLGLLDPPSSGGAAGYGEKHRLQLIGIRLLQAQAVPLRRIRDLLYGRSLEDLRTLIRRGAEELEAGPAGWQGVLRPEQWTVTPLTGEFLLVSRHGRAVPRPVLGKIAAMLCEAFAAEAARSPVPEPSTNEP